MHTVIFKAASGREFTVRATPKTIRSLNKVVGSPHRRPTSKELRDASVSAFVGAVRDAGLHAIR